jgi:hypothetical protein
MFERLAFVAERSALCDRLCGNDHLEMARRAYRAYHSARVRRSWFSTSRRADSMLAQFRYGFSHCVVVQADSAFAFAFKQSIKFVVCL